MESRKWKNKNLFQAFCHSIEGIEYAFKSEKSLKIEFVCTILAIFLGILLELTCIEFAIVFLTIGVVLLAEFINTAIEIILDLYSQEYNEKIKLAKDIASGAVLIVSIASVMVAAFLFLPKILNKLI